MGLICIGQVTEEFLKSRGNCGIEGRSAQRIGVACGALEALVITTGEYYLCALRPRPSGSLKPDASASADHDNSLIQALRFSLEVRYGDSSAHNCSD